MNSKTEHVAIESRGFLQVVHRDNESCFQNFRHTTRDNLRETAHKIKIPTLSQESRSEWGSYRLDFYGTSINCILPSLARCRTITFPFGSRKTKTSRSLK